MAEFDVKQVGTYEWLGIGAGAVAFINSFLPWLSAGGFSVGAWNGGFFAIFSVLLLIGAAVVVLLPHFGVAVQQRTMIWLALAGVAFLFTLLAWLVSFSGFGGVGVFIGLAAAIASAAGAFLTYQQTAPKAT